MPPYPSLPHHCHAFVMEWMERRGLSLASDLSLPRHSPSSLLLRVHRLAHAGLAGRDAGKRGVLDLEHPVQHVLDCGGPPAAKGKGVLENWQRSEVLNASHLAQRVRHWNPGGVMRGWVGWAAGMGEGV